jgi:hypothetical protein
MSSLFADDSRKVSWGRLTLENLQKHDASERHWFQYGCEGCKVNWWRKVPLHKPISRCIKCRRKYEPLQEKDFFGRGRYECPHYEQTKKKNGKVTIRYCRNVWISDALVDIETELNCRECGLKSTPVQVGPPKHVLVKQVRFASVASFVAQLSGSIRPAFSRLLFASIKWAMAAISSILLFFSLSLANHI